MNWSNNDNQLARITGTMLGFEDHGILSSYVYLEYATPGEKIGGSGQGFGGYGLRGKFASFWLDGVLKAVGVDEWEKLKGKMVWVDAEHSKVHSITGVDTGIKFDPSDYEVEDS